MELILLCILLIFYIVMSIIDYLDIKKQRDTPTEENIKMKLYKETILWGWIPVIFIFLVVIITPITMTDIGFRYITLNFIDSFKYIGAITLVLCISFLALLCYQIINYCVSPKYRELTKNQVINNRNSGNHYERVVFNVMIPVTRKEKKWFALVSLTAGIGEEIVFRGFLFFLIISLIPNITILAIPPIAALIFGIAHFYQGCAGVIKTFLVGTLIGFLYITLDSILPCIILHFVMDFSSNFIYSADKNEITNLQV